MSDNTNIEILRITGGIVSAYIAKHPLEISDLTHVINRVYHTVNDLNRHQSILRKSGPLVPAVPIEESVHDEYIVCLEDGKKLQMLKRHLSTMYNMTVEQYRDRWSLPLEYPVVAPKYAKRRSEIAKSAGLGVNGRRKRNSIAPAIQLLDHNQQLTNPSFPGVTVGA